ncbi:hypothetical protein BDF20DRAFT_818127 [Mycotypha africana]|uniref:uncharacterized protein n=1 Tax=Mycotypha africana TaxID=64632 RepID=UPI002301A9CB|nr:uncharacterized protein BDF20DRAFT_818127 [Mycotypha africana]KAI8981680.1 hypothetical protein BDF20DRAFT_818127 [Mycotypha africana]
MCTLRLRVLYKTKNCAYCKVEAAKVVFTTNGEKPYENYKREDTPYYDKKYGIRFETEEMYNETLVLLQHNCPDMECEADAFDSWNELKRHVKQAHQGKLLCDLCLRNKKIFSHEHTLYTNAQLPKHYREGDASFNKEDETGFTGHPECVFCRTRFYGGDELFEHCRIKHEQCHLCVKHGIQHQYYANYNSLEKHFNEEHFLCQYKESHELNEHSGTLSRQQRAKQSRVDVNLSYSGEQPRTNSRNQRADSSNSSHTGSNTPTLSAADFPSIDGRPGPASLLVSQRAESGITEREHWPLLGEEPRTDRSGRSSPAVSNEPDTSIVSRHAAAFDRVANLLKNVENVIKFRQLITGFINLSIDTAAFVDKVYELCKKDPEFTAKVLTAANDLVDDKTLRSDVIQIWNKMKNPVSFIFLNITQNKTS